LREHGVRVRVELAPLVPGLTDTRDNLRPVLEALAAVGVRQVTAGYLSLRPGTPANLHAALHGAEATVLAQYAGGPMLRTEGGLARHLPKARRQRGYAALMALAAEHAVGVSVCSLTNPDFGTPRPTGEMGPRLGLLARAWEKSVG
jgi:DNA repair photolyase